MNAKSAETSGYLADLDQSSWPYWQGLEQGRLLIQQCASCGEQYFYPRPFCPFCASRDVSWLEATGAGQVYSYTVLPKVKPGPAIIAFVTLDEGPTILSRLEAVDPDNVAIDMKVKSAFAYSERGEPLLTFKPA